MEKDPKHGIQVRPPKVLAEEDIRSVSGLIKICNSGNEISLNFFLQRATPIHCT